MQIKIASQFMKNYEAGSPVSSDREIATAKDAQNNLMFFSIGSDNHLYLFQKDSGTPTGWQRTDLSADLGQGIEVSHIATAQDKDGKPILAVIAYDVQYRNNPKVYFTKNFTSSSTPERWIFRGNQLGVEITHIATGEDKNGKVLITISTQQEGKMVNYLVNPDLSDKSWLWREIPVPLNGKGVVELAIGHNQKLEQIDGVDGVLYSLIQVDQQTTKVVLTSLPDFDLYNHEIPVSFSPTALSIISDFRGNSELFLATDRLYHLDIQAQMTKDQSQLSQNIINVGRKTFTHTAKKIINGRYINGALEAWVLTKDGNLYFTNEKESQGWLEPYPLDKEIGQITAWRNSTTNAIDLFASNIDNQLHHLWQDLTTTRWQEQQIILGGINQQIEYDSYTSQIIVTDDQGFPVVGKTFTITASELTTVTINGNKYFVDPSADVATCQTDALGSITIINKVQDLVSPIIRVQADFLEKVIDLNPNRHIEDKLAQMTPEDFKNAQLQTYEDGVTEPLFKSPHQNDLTGTHQAIQELLKLQHQLPSRTGEVNAKISQTDLDREGVTIAAKATPISHQLNLAAIPDGYYFGLDLTGANPIFSNKKDHIQANFLANYHRKLAAPQSFIGGIFADIEHPFGNVWRAIKKGFFTVTHLVIEKVQEGIKIVINGIEDAVHVIVQFAEQVWHVVQLVFEKIGVFFQDVIRWLGYIFKWKDILRTHDVLKNVFNQTFNLALTKLSSAEDTVRLVFKTVRERVLSQDLGSKLGNFRNQGLKASAQQNQNNYLFASPESNWALHQVSNGNVSAGKPFSPEDLKESITNLGDIAADELAVLENAFQAIGEDIAQNFEHLSIGQFVDKLLTILEATLIDTIENVALGLLEVAKLAIKAIAALLNIRWDIPVITPLYENIIAPGSKLSLIDVFTLLIAIPTTISYKVIAGKTPFSETQARELAGATSHAELIKCFKGENNNPIPLLSSEKATSPASTALAASDDPPPEGVRIATYILGLANSVATITYGILNSREVITSDLPIFKTSTVKVWTGIFSNLLSYTSIVLIEAITVSAHQGLLAYETFVTFYQAAFNVKDVVAWCYDKQSPKNDKAMKALSWVETGFGSVNAVLFIALTIAERVDGQLTPSNGLKLPQNLLTSTSQILSGPSTVSTQPEVEVIFLVVQGVLGIFPGLINSGRVVMSIVGQEIHKIF